MAEGAVAAGPLCARLDAAQKIRLIIASPVHLVRDAMAAALRGRDDIAVVDTIDLDSRGVAKLADAQPDVVLVDLGQTDPAAAARLIAAVGPGARLVAFGLDETFDQVFACASAGFAGYVPRQGGADELYCAVMDAVEGRVRCAPHIAAAMFARLAGLSRPGDSRDPPATLSSREGEILALVEQGRSNKEIARQLAISTATVKNHLHNILQKLKVNSRGEAAARLRSPRG